MGVSELGPYKLTVGKIFAAKLIVETWRAGQARKTELNGRQQVNARIKLLLIFCLLVIE
jgi:hypothetical protein